MYIMCFIDFNLGMALIIRQINILMMAIRFKHSSLIVKKIIITRALRFMNIMEFIVFNAFN